MSMPLHPSEATRLGRYELVGRLGRGGMGAVYLGRSPEGRMVAIKVIRAELTDHELRARFRSEVNRLRQVPSFSTAAVLDADLDHDPAYLVVEYVDGPSLADVVRDRGPMSPDQLHSVAVGLTTALSAIHGAGIIHRDLKPDNVLLPVGGVKVIDFGIARTLDATSLHTRTDQMVGTVAYMAPERFASDGSRTVTPAADIFAWGVMVAFAATGRTPFASDSPPATAMKILSQPPNLSGLAPPMRDLVERALAKDPAQRPTARELLDALIVEEKPALGRARVTPPAGMPRSLERLQARTSRRRKRNALAAAGAAVALTAAAVLGLAFSPISAPAGEPAASATELAAPRPGGVAAAGPSSAPRKKGGAAPTPATGKATPEAMLELLSRTFPDRELSRPATLDDGLGVQVLMDGDQGPGSLSVVVERDDNPDTDVRTAGPKVTVERNAGNCVQDLLARADWDDGTHVLLSVSTCLPWDGGRNKRTASALTESEARRLVSDPRWGVTMDAELVTAGAKHFPDVS